MNHILTNFMNNLKKPHGDNLKSELIIEVLKVCPDQLHWYLPSLKDSVTPRLSGNWIKCMEFVIKVRMIGFIWPGMWPW